MPKTANTLIMDALVRHQVYLLRLAGSIRNGMNYELDKTTEELGNLIRNYDKLKDQKLLSKSFQDEMERLTNKIARVRSPGYVAAEKFATDQLASIAEGEADFVQRAISSGIGSNVPMKMPTAAVINNILALGTYNGLSVKQWFTGWADGDIRRVESAVRSGLVQGQTLDQITRAIVGTKKLNYTDGVVNTTRKTSESLARTLTNGVTNSARTDFYERNSDIISSIRFTATLDARTTELCASLDGSEYPKATDAPQPPLHVSCRSTLSPVVDGFGVVGNRPSVGGTNFNEKAREEYVKSNTAKGLSEKDARAKWSKLSNSRKNKLRNDQIKAWNKNVIGSVPAKMSYNDWLKTQPVKFQNDVLGKTKAEIWRKGGLDKNGKKIEMSTFIDYNANKPYTLEQLKIREPQLFAKDAK